jgi:hypothetical protein
MSAETLWQRLLEHLVTHGVVLRSASGATPGDVAAVADRARGDALVSQFVERYYYPHCYGAADEALPEPEATALIQRILSPQAGKTAAAGGAFTIEGGPSFPSLAQALDAALPGATIVVAPGHHQVAAVIERDVRIVGRGDRAGIVLEGVGGPAVRVSRGGCELRHLTLTRSAKATTEWTAVVHVEGGAPTIVGCRIEGRGHSAAVAVYGDAVSVLDDCTIEGEGDEKNVGVEFGYRASGEMRNCRIDRFAVGLSLAGRANPRVTACVIGPVVRNAIKASEEAQGQIIDCDLKQEGVAATSKGGFPLVYIEQNAAVRFERCLVHDAPAAGVYLEGGSCSIEGGTIRSVHNGVAATKQTQAALRGVRFSKTTKSAVYAGGGKIDLEDCIVEDSGADGFALAEDGTLTARRCRVSGSALAGLGVFGGTALLEGCELRGSQGQGVCFYDEGGSVTLRHCIVTDSKLDGVEARGVVFLHGSDVVSNGGDGISGGAHPLQITDCRILENVGRGLSVTGSRSRLTGTTVARNGSDNVHCSGNAVLLAKSCRIADAGGCGVFAVAEAHVVLADSTIDGSSDKCGIEIGGTSRVALFRVNVAKSGLYGIFAGDSARLRARQLSVVRSAKSGVHTHGAARAWLHVATVSEAGSHGLEASGGSHLACVSGNIVSSEEHGVAARDRTTRVALAVTSIRGSGKAAVHVDRDAEVEARRSAIPAGSLLVTGGGRTVGLS